MSVFETDHDVAITFTLLARCHFRDALHLKARPSLGQLSIFSYGCEGWRERERHHNRNKTFHVLQRIFSPLI